MIIKSYELKKNLTNIKSNNFYLLYGENFGLKKELKSFITNTIKEKNQNTEILTLYENEVIEKEENFYNYIYSGSLFSEKKIIIIYDASDKLINKIDDIYEEFPETTYLIILSQNLEKKSKLRNFFEKNKKTYCIPCYEDNEKDLEIIAQYELKKDNLILSREIINLLIEKANADRNNLRNEIEKIKSFLFNKKNINIEEIKKLINFSGDYKSEIFVNECLCGNTIKYRKIISEMYSNTVNQILLFRILGNKIQRLLKIKEQKNISNNFDNLINEARPPIFWKEKPLVKKQLNIWSLKDLRNIIDGINKTELLCKKNSQVSNSIFFNFFSEICRKANNFA